MSSAKEDGPRGASIYVTRLTNVRGLHLRIRDAFDECGGLHLHVALDGQKGRSFLMCGRRVHFVTRSTNGRGLHLRDALDGQMGRSFT